ncbi:hypothetical protein EJB05_38182, partial [Eragrostis curvula]
MLSSSPSAAALEAGRRSRRSNARVGHRRPPPPPRSGVGSRATGRSRRRRVTVAASRSPPELPAAPVGKGVVSFSLTSQADYRGSEIHTLNAIFSNAASTPRTAEAASFPSPTLAPCLLPTPRLTCRRRPVAVARIPDAAALPRLPASRSPQPVPRRRPPPPPRRLPVDQIDHASFLCRNAARSPDAAFPSRHLLVHGPYKELKHWDAQIGMLFKQFDELSIRIVQQT